jgi:hypothetical protein
MISEQYAPISLQQGLHLSMSFVIRPSHSDFDPRTAGFFILNNISGRPSSDEPALIAEFVRSYGVRAWEEFRAIARERNPSFFFESLLSFAARREHEGQEDLAFHLYTIIAREARPLNAAVATQAERRGAALAGQGPLNLRIEPLLRSLNKEMFTWTPLVTLGISRILSRVSQTFALGRLLSSPATHWWTRGASAETLAGLLGLTVDGVSFTSLRRWLDSKEGTRGPNLSWGEEFGANLLLLGGWRLGEWPMKKWLPGAKFLASPAGQFAAIYSGNLVASQGADPAAALFHSFGWFIHSGLAERFSRSLIGFPFYLRRPHSPTLVPTWRSPLLAANGGRLLVLRSHCDLRQIFSKCPQSRKETSRRRNPRLHPPDREPNPASFPRKKKQASPQRLPFNRTLPLIWNRTVKGLTLRVAWIRLSRSLFLREKPLKSNWL